MLRRARLPRVPAPHYACAALAESNALVASALQQLALHARAYGTASKPGPALHASRLLASDLYRGFSASALDSRLQHGVALRRRPFGAHAVRLLHASVHAGDDASARAARPGATIDAPSRDVHTSAATSTRDEAEAAREVRANERAVRAQCRTRRITHPHTHLQVVSIDDLAEVRAEAARTVQEAKAAEGGSSNALVAGSKAATAWLLTVPAKLGGLARMSRAEWATMLSGAWVAVKKEAHHFWVRRACDVTSDPNSELALIRSPHRTQVGSKLLYAEVQISARLIGNVVRGHPLSRCVVAVASCLLAAVR